MQIQSVLPSGPAEHYNKISCGYFVNSFEEVRSERIVEIPKLADLTYAHTLVVIKSIPEWDVGTIWPMDLVFMSTFDDQSMSIA